MDGYHKLASVMGSHPDVRIFRNFSMLNIQNILYLQAELVHLQKEWQDIILDDARSGVTARVDIQFDVLKLQEGTETEDETLQWGKFKEIRAKLAQYNTALLEISQLSTIPAPAEDRLRVLQDWLERPAYGNAFLRGVEARTWGIETGVKDFVAVGVGQHEHDAMTRWIRRVIPGAYHGIVGHRLHSAAPDDRPDSGIFNYKEDALSRTIQILSTVLSSLAPTISIFILFYIQSTVLRLGLILVFTTLFAAILSIFTEAKKIEVFAATTAFAAVEVVFVGSVIGSSS